MCGGSGDDLGEGLKRGRWGWMLGPKMVVTPRLKYRLLSLKTMQNHPLPKRRERHQVERERRRRAVLVGTLQELVRWFSCQVMREGERGSDTEEIGRAHV